MIEKTHPKLTLVTPKRPPALIIKPVASSKKRPRAKLAPVIWHPRALARELRKNQRLVPMKLNR